MNTKRTREEICVYFDAPERTIEPGSAFTWIVEYGRTAEVYLHEILGYDLFIDPQREFQGVPVMSHHFDVKIAIATPNDASWRRIKRWRLHQRNSLDFTPNISLGNETTTYRFSFDTVDEPFDLRIAAVYGFMSKFIAGAHFLAATAVVTLLHYGPSLAIELWRHLRGHG